MKYPKVFVIILNYNGRNTVRRCLDSVYKCDYPNLEVVLVDNNSSDGSFEYIKKRFSKVHFIKNSENLGFSAGNNVGIKFALERMAQYVFLLNNDAWIQEDTISKLVQFSKHYPSAGIISPLILKEDNKPWFSGGRIDWMRMRTVHNDNNQMHNDYITGCAMLVKKEVFGKIGLFDEDYFLYYEDADFSLRAKKAGFEVKVCKDCAVHHSEKSEVENPNKVYWLVLSGIIFFKKNTPRYWKPWVTIYLFLRKLKNKRDVKRGDSEIARKVQQAYKDAKLFFTKK